MCDYSCSFLHSFVQMVVYMTIVLVFVLHRTRAYQTISVTVRLSGWLVIQVW